MKCLVEPSDRPGTVLFTRRYWPGRAYRVQCRRVWNLRAARPTGPWPHGARPI